MASFKVRETFTVGSRSLFVLSGEILEGEVRAGMCVRVGVNSSHVVSFQVASVEFVDHSDRADIGLCIRYADEAERSVLQGLAVKGEVLEVAPWE